MRPGRQDSRLGGRGQSGLCPTCGGSEGLPCGNSGTASHPLSPTSYFGARLPVRPVSSSAWNPVYSVSPTLNLGPSNPRAQPTALRWRRPTSVPFFRRWSLVRHVDVRKGFGDFKRQLKNYSKLVRLCPCVSPMLQAKAPPSAESRADLNHRGLAGPPRTAFPHFVPYAQEVGRDREGGEQPLREQRQSRLDKCKY